LAVWKREKSAKYPSASFPLSDNRSAAAARKVIPAKTSAFDSFSKVPNMAAWANKFPMGADPGLWSLAMAKAPPASRIFLAGVNLQPSPKEAPGNAVAMVLIGVHGDIEVHFFGFFEIGGDLRCRKSTFFDKGIDAPGQVFLL